MRATTDDGFFVAACLCLLGFPSTLLGFLACKLYDASALHCTQVLLGLTVLSIGSLPLRP